MIVPLSTIFLLDCGTVPTVWYFFSSFHKYMEHEVDNQRLIMFVLSPQDYVMCGAATFYPAIFDCTIVDIIYVHV
jgi:hypothetical protein